MEERSKESDITQRSIHIFSRNAYNIHGHQNSYSRTTRTTQPIARRLLHEIKIYCTMKLIRETFCWTPSHVGIEGNEKADRAAVEAAAGPEKYIVID